MCFQRSMRLHSSALKKRNGVTDDGGDGVKDLVPPGRFSLQGGKMLTDTLFRNDSREIEKSLVYGKYRATATNGEIAEWRCPHEPFEVLGVLFSRTNLTFRDLHRFIPRVTVVGGEDNLFGSAGEVPEAFRALIEDQAGARGATPSPLDDYRRFFRFEVEVRQDDRVIGTLSERMRSGSGGEHRAPLYVIAGAALAAAYGKSETETGGLGLILLDEFGDKIDAQNARATTNYLRSLGLQLVLAAPDTAQGTLSGVLDSYIELFRDGDLLQVEHVEVTEAGRALLQSDQFDLHPELLAQETQRIEHERGLP